MDASTDDWEMRRARVRARKRLRHLRRRARWRAFKFRVRDTWNVATGKVVVGCDCEDWD